jgi:hypothetical protein
LRDSFGLNVQTGKAAPSALNHRQRRTAGTAGHVKDATLSGEAQKIGDLGLLVGASPAFLSNVLAENLPPYFCGEFANDTGIMKTVKAGARGFGFFAGHSGALLQANKITF